MWYHDHAIDITAENVYRGLAGFYVSFNTLDTGNETDPPPALGLPSGDFDIGLVIQDRLFDRNGFLVYDNFDHNGFLGDKFLVNGKIQPFFQVHPRRCRFRWLNTGPSRFLELFLTDPNNLSAHHPFWQISHDGNLLPRPLLVESVGMAVAERSDVIIDFSQLPPGSSLFIENRLEQKDGRGPTNRILPAGQGNLLLRFDVVLPPVADNSADPATITHLLDVPAAPQNIVTRGFRFDRQNGMWAINGRLMDDDCETIRFRAKLPCTSVHSTEPRCRQVLWKARRRSSSRTSTSDCVPMRTVRQSPALASSSSRATATQRRYQKASSSR